MEQGVELIPLFFHFDDDKEIKKLFDGNQITFAYVFLKLCR